MGFGYINLGTSIGLLMLVDGLVTAGETSTIAGLMDVGLIAFDFFFLVDFLASFNCEGLKLKVDWLDWPPNKACSASLVDLYLIFEVRPMAEGGH